MIVGKFSDLNILTFLISVFRCFMRTHTEPRRSSARCLTTSCMTNCETSWTARRHFLMFMIKSTKKLDHTNVIKSSYDTVPLLIWLLLYLFTSFPSYISLFKFQKKMLDLKFFWYNFLIPKSLHVFPLT